MSKGAIPCNFSLFSSAKQYPFPFSVFTNKITGPYKSFIFFNIGKSFSILFPSHTLKNLKPKLSSA